jgi:hypothetical protein
MSFTYDSSGNYTGNTESGSNGNWTQPGSGGSMSFPGGGGGGGGVYNPQITSYGINTASQVNAQNRYAQTLANQSRLGPSGVALQDTLVGNAQRKASGLLDPETEQMLRAGIASSGVSSGMGVDSANLASAYRRALGIDINAVEGQALTDYSRLTGDNPGAPVVGAQGFLTQPNTGGGAPAVRGGGGGGGSASPATAPADPFGVPGGGGYSGAGPTNPYTDVSGVYSPSGNVTSQNVNPFDPYAGMDYFSGTSAQANPFGSMPNYNPPGNFPAGAPTIANANAMPGGGTGTTGNLGDLGFGDWYTTNYGG